MDNSRSMADTGCSGFACEAVVALARALARLEVGSLGIVRFGGGGEVRPLHPLDRPFTDADGPGVLAQLRFDQVWEGLSECLGSRHCWADLLWLQSGVLRGGRCMHAMSTRFWPLSVHAAFVVALRTAVLV